MRRVNNAEAFAQLKDAMSSKGIRGAVEYLNSLTSQRFTSLYRFDGDMLHNLYFYDRENPIAERCDDIPVLASYCVFVRDRKENFEVHDSRNDERVAHHPKRQEVLSYCGVPLTHEGKMFGTICHFGFLPGRVSEEDVELMEYMAQLLQAKVKELHVASTTR